ncbi:translation initiation factor IF-2 subunit gamma [Candidatus Woesearchaeota archaeon]|nr:MAG: translation initiation factor IF-2 subunit gamma [Candidatus Woesearchaeota archaeon]
MAKKAEKATEEKKVKSKKTEKKEKTEKAEPKKIKTEDSAVTTLPVQPSINIGLVGHVDHGKTTLTEALSGKWTDTHSEEIKRGITIRLGYADCTFYYCEHCKKYTIFETCKDCNETAIPKRRVSFVDAPGHESLMATMLSGSTIMDGALLLIDSHEECPQPQTREHLMALHISGIKNIVIVQNKIDLISKEQALKNYQQIKEFLKGTEYEHAPIIPISALKRVNIDLLIDAIEKHIPTPERDVRKEPLMLIARSFDVNKPGTKPKQLKGGVLGGAVTQGKLKLGDEIEISPGRILEEANQIVAKPLRTIITQLVTGGKEVSEVVPGGSIGLMTALDPGIVKGDSLTGSVVGLPGKLPKIWYELKLELHLLDRVVGSKEDLKVEPIKKNEMLLLNVNSSSTVGLVYDFGKNTFQCKLKIPVCGEVDSRVTISRRIGNRFRLIGYGIIKA